MVYLCFSLTITLSLLVHLTSSSYKLLVIPHTPLALLVSGGPVTTYSSQSELLEGKDFAPLYPMLTIGPGT